MKKNSKGFTLVELLVVIGILGVLMGVLIPQIASAMMKANMSACAMKGHKLWEAITQANIDRTAIGLGSVWPKTEAEEGADTAKDPLAGAVSSASEYFTYLLDMAKITDSANWRPYVSDVDVAILNGFGVPAIQSGATKIDGKNCMWCVAANVGDELPGVYPVLFTRNIPLNALQQYEKTYDGGSDEIKLGKTNGAKYDTPFSNKGFILIRKDGSTVNQPVKYALSSVVFNKQPYNINTDPAPKFLDVE